MANIYVRNTDGSDSDNGSTWALAKATLTGAAAIDAAGDTIYLSQAHSESTSAPVTIALAGTASNPVNVICGNDAAGPPTAVATTAIIATTLTNAITVSGSCYVFGVSFDCATGATSASINLSAGANQAQIYDNCALRLNSTGVAGTRLNLGNTSTGQVGLVELHDCVLRFSGNAQGLTTGKTRIKIIGGSIESGSTAQISGFFRGNPASGVSDIVIRNFDFSNLGSACSMHEGFGANHAGTLVIQDCKMPSGWSGGVGVVTSPSFRASMYNCDNADTNYRLWIEDYAGSIVSETTIVRTGGATDGTTPISWKLTTSANANEYVAPLISDPISVWNETTGSAKTITVEIVHDSVTALDDDEVWVEVTYLGTSGYPLGSVITDHRTNILATPAAQTSSSETWTTTGLTNPNKQRLSVSITPQEKGFITARVFVGKPSYTIYVDPEITVT